MIFFISHFYDAENIELEYPAPLNLVWSNWNQSECCIDPSM